MKVFSLTALATACLALSAAADEIIVLRGKNLTDVSVREETFKEITYRRAGVRVNQTIDVADVKEVIYSRESEHYANAMHELSMGNFKGAALAFQAAAANPPSTMSWIKQYGLFNAAESLRLARDYDAAVKAYDKLLADVPNTRFYGDALLQKAMCFEAARDAAKSTAALDALAAAAADPGIGERWRLMAEYHKLRQAGAQTTLQQFDDLQKRAERAGANTVANLARLGVGNSLIDAGQLEDARAYFQDIVDARQASPAQVVAGAYLGLGNTYVRKDDPTADDYHQALWCFARVVFHYGDELHQSEMLAEGLYWVGRCFEERTHDKDLNASRARQMFTRVINEFPSTRWAELAGER